MYNKEKQFIDANLQKDAIILFMPDGKVISVNKIKEYKYILDYFKLIAMNIKEIGRIISPDDLDYYINNPIKVMSEVWPQYLKENIIIYINSMHNTSGPTQTGLLFLPENPTIESINSLKKVDDQLETLYIDIAHYYNDSGTYNIIESQKNGMLNSNDIINIIKESKEIEKNNIK